MKPFYVMLPERYRQKNYARIPLELVAIEWDLLITQLCNILSKIIFYSKSRETWKLYATKGWDAELCKLKSSIN